MRTVALAKAGRNMEAARLLKAVVVVGFVIPRMCIEPFFVLVCRVWDGGHTVMASMGQVYDLALCTSGQLSIKS